MSVIKVLCTADLHLGRASACLITPTDVDVTAVGAWRRIVHRAIEEHADLVAIAGDIFDSLAAYLETRESFAAGLDRLAEAKIPVVAVTGNHDCEATKRFRTYYPKPGFKLLGLEGWETADVETSNGTLTLVGWSFPSPTYPGRAFDGFRRPDTRHPVLGLVHGDAADPNSRYHPLRASDLEDGAHAWLLGHIHVPSRVGSRAIYPGSPQALDFGPGERGPHGVFWLEIGSSGAQFSALEPLSTVLFADHSIDIKVEEGADAFSVASTRSERRIAEIRSEVPSVQSVQARLGLTYTGLQQEPEFDPAPEPVNGSDAYLWIEQRLGYSRDPWEDAAVNDVYGEAARMLLGARAGAGIDEGRAVDPDWIARAEQQIDRLRADVSDAFRSTLAKASDGGDSQLSAPSEDEARSMAREAFAAQLEDVLRLRRGSRA